MFYVDGLVHEWVPHRILSGTVYNQFSNVHVKNVLIKVSTFQVHLYMQSQVLCAIELGRMFNLTIIKHILMMKSNGIGYKDFKLNFKKMLLTLLYLVDDNIFKRIYSNKLICAFDTLSMLFQGLKQGRQQGGTSPHPDSFR